MESNKAGAVVLYNSAVKESGNGNGMYNLALLLEDGRDGVSADPICAANLYNRAIEEGSNTNAMFFLAVVLQSGRDGVLVDPICDVHL